MPLKYPDRSSGYYDYPLTIRQLLSSTVSVAGGRRIHYQDRSSYDYPTFVKRIGQLASTLASLGVDQGATVAMMDWDSPRYLEAYFAVPMMGAVLQTVNIRLPETQIAYTIDHADAEVLIVHRDFFPIVEEIRSRLPKVRLIVAILDGVEEDLPGWAAGEYAELTDHASSEYPFVDIDENALATTFYTTGTTGNPKGVSFTHRQLVLHTLASCGQFGVTEDCGGVSYRDVYMPLTPMFHVHAWGSPYTATMLATTQVYPGRYDADLFCKLRTDLGVTYSHCVPTVLQMLLDAAERNGTDVAGWKIGVGGSALSRALYDRASEAGVAVYTGYGMSESAPTACKARKPLDLTDPEFVAQQAISCGVPVPLVNIRIVDEDMNALPHDGMTKGELVMRAPWLTPSYTKDEAASEELWRGGWMHTQDIASIDPDGTVRIRDRVKDVIKSGGEWIDSLELENLLASVDGVAEVAVVAAPDARWGERPLPFIVLQPGAQVVVEDLNAPIMAAIEDNRLTRYARLDRFVVLEQLPRTSVGKIDKKLLRADLQMA